VGKRGGRVGIRALEEGDRMSDAPAILRRSSDGVLLYWCPGCKSGHKVSVDQPNDTGSCWTWNGSMERPTFRPSVLVHERPGGHRCHSHVVDGQIQFLTDCTHALAGQTVPMEEF